MDRSWIFAGTVTRVVDADTFDINVDLGFDISQDIRFRLTADTVDFDAPETWRPKYKSEREHGEAATALVRDLIENKYVTIKSVRRGKYRYVAVIYVSINGSDPVDLAQHLIVSGYQKFKESVYIKLDKEILDE